MKDTCIITAELVHTILRKRRREIHKGDCGRILAVAGSEGMMGAAVLTCRAALRSGAGLVQLAIPWNLFPIPQTAVPEATCRERSFSAGDLAAYDAVAAGPGLGTEEESVETVRNILELYRGNLVLDADALNILARAENGCMALLRKRSDAGCQTVITPHIGEAKRLLSSFSATSGRGWETPVTREERLFMARTLSDLTGAVTVLKGAGTVVATGGDGSYINTTGNPGMATGGSGDVLTGIIAGLWGQKQPEENGKLRRLEAFEAAFCGVFLHGLAGDLAAEELGEYGLTAGDIAAMTPYALKKVLEK